MSAEAHTPADYIRHHLTHLQVCKTDEGWVWNECAGKFMAVNVDSMVISVGLLIFLCWLFRRVAVKATTSERLGFTGREEGIAATASATIRLPWTDKGWSV